MPRYVYFAKRVTKSSGKVKTYPLFFPTKKEVKDFLKEKQQSVQTKRFVFAYYREYRCLFDL